MCLNVAKIYKQGTYKADCVGGKKGDSYQIETWQKCGHCVECANEKANNWLVRNYYEAKEHEKKCFITLTYATSPRVLIKKDLQDFIKRLRFHLDKKGCRIRYFGCGEYGTINGRPHYHLIIYGWEDEKPHFVEWNKKGNAVFESKIITETWGRGRTSYQEFNEKEIAYVSLYTSANENAYKPMIAIKELAAQLEKAKNPQARERIEKQIEAAEENKKKLYAVKEFCVWSEGIGFDRWIKEYDGEVWTEYINDREFMTPSPWIKRIANEGDAGAITEMLKRKEFEIDRAETVEARKAFKTSKANEADAKT